MTRKVWGEVGEVGPASDRRASFLSPLIASVPSVRTVPAGPRDRALEVVAHFVAEAATERSGIGEQRDREEDVRSRPRTFQQAPGAGRRQLSLEPSHFRRAPPRRRASSAGNSAAARRRSTDPATTRSSSIRSLSSRRASAR